MIGADGVVGQFLLQSSNTPHAQVIGTSRKDPQPQGMLRADLNCGYTSDVLAARPDVVFFCAAITSIQACQDDPVGTWRINVLETVRLAEALVQQGSFVIFLSSNAVFDGKTYLPSEMHQHCPTTCYGMQKAAAERSMLALPQTEERVAIVRLSKVFSKYRGIAADFLGCLKARKQFEAFDDLRISPISLPYVANAMFTIARRRLAGVFHLSGVEEMTYFEFGRRLATHFSKDAGLVLPATSRDRSISPLFRPRHPAMGMGLTTEILGVTPEPTADLFEILGSC